ncbi:serine hydrolase [Lysinibacillus macroides]|uniref:D-alanyl-D-alanine carboxypeptidase n=1 Tax=Lysinibacillus macroides TaxID=33935 RepID=A0A0M9DLS1_9BACI|nr:serine hydrolase [Lysinibacillus macroides]KOY83000.1 D-alanyl-D-alanine carboxypeptidase [Lysinibacillus macroides]QPR70151.1 serine hydrolase [Lysinibacillus macroides]
MKLVLWVIVGIVAALILIIGVVAYRFYRELKTPNPDYIINFIKEHAAKGNVALSIHYNSQNLVSINESVPLPLASTVKIIIAIEYAQQAAEGKIDPNQMVSLKELDKFYIPRTDGGGHQAWLAQLQREQEIASVPLYKVAKAMIAYSSNANTDYLINILGLENINETLKQLELLHHDEIYPLTSILYIPQQLMDEKNLSSKEVLEAMREMEMDDYQQRAMAIHKSWLTKPLSEQEKKHLLKHLSKSSQKHLSDHFPRSTAKDYVAIMGKLNNKTYFSDKVYQYLDPVMEQLMERPKNRELFTQIGQKGGSTLFVVTIAMYAIDREQNKTELAFFANDLSDLEQVELARNMNSFQLKLLTDKAFRERVNTELN